MKTHHVVHRSIGIIAIAAGLAGCGGSGTSADERSASSANEQPGTPAAQQSFVATLAPTQGNNVRGTVRFSAEGEAVRVRAEITGLTPGDHGIHIHENGDCSAADASSAGGHFNPTKQPHGGRDDEARHLGDLGNLTADANGRAELDHLDRHLTLTGPNRIVGRAVIVHAGRDDLKSQPTGDSGARVACGVIE